MRICAIGLTIGAILGLSFPLLAQEEQQPATAPSPILIVPGHSIAGVIIGRTIRSVVARLGPPSEVRAVREGTLYVFSRFGITVYGDGEMVAAVSASNSLFRTPEGISLGSSEADVRRTYGAQFTPAVVEGFSGFAYEHLGLAFGFDRGSVAIILVFSPRGLQAYSAFVALPRVEDLKPFSAATRYMSLPGYLRYLVFEQSGVWLSYAEAGRIIREPVEARG